jgi:hypothetical protein
MSGDPQEPIPKTPWRRYFAGPAVGVACVLVVVLVAWWRGCPPDPPRPATFVEEAGVDLAASTPVEFGGRKGWLVGGKVVLDPVGGADAGSRDE